MTIISLRQIQIHYPWIANSSHFNEMLKDLSYEEREDIMDDESDFPIYESGNDLRVIFYVINFLGSI